MNHFRKYLCSWLIAFTVLASPAVAAADVVTLPGIVCGRGLAERNGRPLLAEAVGSRTIGIALCLLGVAVVCRGCDGDQGAAHAWVEQPIPLRVPGSVPLFQLVRVLAGAGRCIAHCAGRTACGGIKRISATPSYRAGLSEGSGGDECIFHRMCICILHSASITRTEGPIRL